MTLAIVNVFPEPVTSRRVWLILPRMSSRPDYPDPPDRFFRPRQFPRQKFQNNSLTGLCLESKRRTVHEKISDIPRINKYSFKDIITLDDPDSALSHIIANKTIKVYRISSKKSTNVRMFICTFLQLVLYIIVILRFSYSSQNPHF